MADVFKMIEGLRDRLWADYGDVLARENTQEEKHLTYYLSKLLNKHGFFHARIEGETYYTERATQQAFIAGLRIGLRDAEDIGKRIADERMSDAIDRLRGTD